MIDRLWGERRTISAPAAGNPNPEERYVAFCNWFWESHEARIEACSLPNLSQISARGLRRGTWHALRIGKWVYPDR
jgi:hypothetical protein